MGLGKQAYMFLLVLQKVLQQVLLLVLQKV
jgi:hypothetical protein